MSNFQFGLLNGVGFTAVYTIVGLFAGSLADRYDRSTVIGFGLMLWSAVTTATGFAHNFLQMTLARMLIGVGEPEDSSIRNTSNSKSARPPSLNHPSRSSLPLRGRRKRQEEPDL